MDIYNTSLYSQEMLTCDQYSCPEPNLPRILDVQKGDSFSSQYPLSQGDYDDWEFDGIAGKYISVDLTAYAGHIATTFEIIAPDDSGVVENKTAYVPYTPTSEALQLSESVLASGVNSEYFNQTQCLNQVLTNCSCYSCMCSCGLEFGESFDLSGTPHSYCIPYGLDQAQSQCPGAWTIDFRVYLDPPSGGFTLQTEMTRANPNDAWPMILQVLDPYHTASDAHCSTVDGVVKCCWPYGGNSQDVGCPPRVGDMRDMAASVMWNGNVRKVENRVSEKGWYTVRAKAYGFMGGNFVLSMATKDAAVVNDETKTIQQPGLIQYGSTVGGVINTTGQVDEWTFVGEENDKVVIAMGPGFAPASVADIARCGKPYGAGLVCLDTLIMLMSPSGKLEAFDHRGDIGDFIGSRIGTYMTDPNPFFTESEQGNIFKERKHLPHVLKENGTYTILATGATFTDDLGQSAWNGLGSVGEYYLQLITLGKNDPLKGLPHCPALPTGAQKGFDEPGCSNFIWKNHNSRPRLAERHPNCEKFYPVGPVVGSDTIPQSPRMYSWKLNKTGKYIIRVRSLINNCFREQIGPMGMSDFVCRPSAGLYDLKMKLTDVPEIDPNIAMGIPNYFGFSDPEPDVDVKFVAYGVETPLNGKCPVNGTATDNDPFNNVHNMAYDPNSICYRRLDLGVDDCESSYKYVDTMYRYGKRNVMDVSRAAFNGTAGDVVCIDVNHIENFIGIASVKKVELKRRLADGTLEYVTVADNFDTWSTMSGNYGTFGKGMGIQGLPLAHTGVYEVWVHGASTYGSYAAGSMNDYTKLTVSLCPDKMESLDANSTSGDCANDFQMEGSFDACVANNEVVISNNGTRVTYPLGSRDPITMSKVGIPFPLTGGGTAPRYYWEVTINGNITDHLYRMGYEGLIAIGFGTRNTEMQGMWLGGDNQAWSFAKASIYNDGASSGYGNEALPGDTVSVALDTGSGQFWMAINGTWQSPSGCGMDLDGTTYNNYPLATESPWTCDPPRPTELSSNPTGSDRFDLAYLIGSPYTGRDKCPIVGPENDTLTTTTPMCRFKAVWSGIDRPSCCFGNPVPDGQCTEGSFSSWYSQHGKKIYNQDWTKLALDPFFGDRRVYPAVQGNGRLAEMSLDINFGKSEFKYKIPCSFSPAIDVVKAANNETLSGTAQSDCWTCKGTCNTHDHSTTAYGAYTCTEYAIGAGTFPYEHYGMLAPS